MTSSKNTGTPLILMSGMGADARVFAKQTEAIPQITVPAWIEPLPRSRSPHTPSG